MFDPKTGIVFPKRHKNTQKTRRHQVERLITKKVIAMARERGIVKFCHDQIQTESSFTQAPNLPSIAFLILSSEVACFFFDLLTFALGLPRGGPLILMPLSLHARSVLSCTINTICMN